MNQDFLGIVGAAGLALILSLVIRSRGWSTALPLIALGAVVDLAPIGPDAPLDPKLILIAILAPLVFGEALGASIRELSSVRRPIFALAIGLVIVTSLAIGWAASLILPGLPFAAACALGAVLAPTDAVAVAASAKRAGLQRRIVSVLEGESLVNDASGLTLLRVALLATAAGTVTFGQVVGILALSVISGLAVGIAFGIVLVFAVRRFPDTVAVNSLVIVAPIPVYFLAEELRGSGILAVVVTALIVASGMHRTVGFRGRMQSLTVWKHITYILQTFAFFIVGMEIPRVIRLLEPDQIQPLLVITAIIVVVLIGARFVFIGAMVAARPHAWGGGSMAWKSATILSWAGARGPISGLAVFTVPLVLDSGDQFPDRNLLVAVTFLVILVTLILAPTLAPLARMLNIPDDDEKEMERVARVAAMRAALERLDALVEDSEKAGDPLPQSVVSALRVPVQEDIASVVAVDSADDTTDELRLRALQREMLHAEQEEIVRMREDGEIPDTVSRRLQSDLDVRLQAARNRRNG